MFDPAGYSVRPDLVSYDPRHSNPWVTGEPDPLGIFMTGVHWLLAHCSVLKVRAVPPGPTTLPGPSDNERPPARGAGGPTQLIPCQQIRRVRRPPARSGCQEEGFPFGT